MYELVKQHPVPYFQCSITTFQLSTSQQIKLLPLTTKLSSLYMTSSESFLLYVKHFFTDSTEDGRVKNLLDSNLKASSEDKCKDLKNLIRLLCGL